MSERRVYARMPDVVAEQAACRGRVDLFDIPPRIHRGKRAHQPLAWLRRERAIVAARTVCNRCPVLEPCRQWAVTDPDPGGHMVLGGLAPEHRDTIRNRRGAA